MASQVAHLPRYGGCLPKALGSKVQSWNREKGTSWPAIKLRPGFFHGGDGLTVKRTHSLGSGAFRSSWSSASTPSALPSLTLRASQTLHQKRKNILITTPRGFCAKPSGKCKSSWEYNVHHNSPSDNGCRNREIMMNQQETHFIRPEGTQGQSPMDSFSINCPVLPSCCWIIDLGVLANTGRFQTAGKRLPVWIQTPGRHRAISLAATTIFSLSRLWAVAIRPRRLPWPHMAFPTDGNFSTFKTPSEHIFLSLVLK